MNLSELRPDRFRKALDLYMGIAYPDGKAPARLRGIADGVRALDDVLGLFTDEERRRGLRAFTLRLGNHRYRNMKMALVEIREGGPFVWSVFTHDGVALSPLDPDREAWEGLRRHNLELKPRIEDAWSADGLPTAPLRGPLG